MPERIAVVAYTQGETVPSARFRVRQYLPMLAAQGVDVRESPARFGSYPSRSGMGRMPWLMSTLTERSRAAWKSVNANVVWLQREMVSTLFTAERLLRRPVVLDVDDAIWLSQRWGAVDALARRSRIVLCGNAFIAEHFAPFAPTRIVPTGVDTAVWRPGARSERPTIVWSGSAAGLPYLYEIEDVLAEVLEAVPDACLRIVSNAAPSIRHLTSDRVEVLKWSPAVEVQSVQSAWVGVMPMPDTPWTRGKCSFKMLTYLACAVPAVASPWGMNAEVIAGGGALAAGTRREWKDALITLLRDGDLAHRLGEAGRAQVEQRYAITVTAPSIVGALRDAAHR